MGLSRVQRAVSGSRRSTSPTSSPRATSSSAAGSARATTRARSWASRRPASKVKWTGTRLFRLKDGKLVEGWINLDMLGLMQQLGVIPSPPPGPQPAPAKHLTGAPSTREANKALMRRFIDEVWNKGNLAVAEEIFHPEATSPSAPTLPPGAEGVKFIVEDDARRLPRLLDGDHPHRRRGRPGRRPVPPGRHPQRRPDGHRADRQEGRVDRDRHPPDRRRQGRRELVRRRHARAHGPARRRRIGRRRGRIDSDRGAAATGADVATKDVIDRYYETANAGRLGRLVRPVHRRHGHGRAAGRSHRVAWPPCGR